MRIPQLVNPTSETKSHLRLRPTRQTFKLNKPSFRQESKKAQVVKPQLRRRFFALGAARASNRGLHPMSMEAAKKISPNPQAVLA